MASSPRLDGLPVELVEKICSLLPFQNHCSLRLVSREVSAKASQGGFLAYFKQKSVCANGAAGVRDLVYMTAPRRLGCRVQHLILYAKAPASTAAVKSGIVEALCSNEDLALAMRHLRTNRVPAELISLTLAVKCQHEDGRIVEASATKKRRRVWEAAGQLFRLVASCLSASALQLGAFDIFEGVPRCSLAMGYLAAVVETYDLSTNLSSLKSLAVSLSPSPPWGTRVSDLQSVELGEGYVASARRLLDYATSMTSLRLHWYSLYKTSPPCATAERGLFATIAQSGSLPHLKHCALRGLHTTADTLRAFIASHLNLSSLCLEELHLSTGSFKDLFQDLTARSTPMEYLHFDDLFEGGHLLYFYEAEGEPKYPSIGRDIGPNDITLSGSAASRRVAYCFKQGRALGHPSITTWRRRRERLYGPPRRIYGTRPWQPSPSSSDSECLEP